MCIKAINKKSILFEIWFGFLNCLYITVFQWFLKSVEFEFFLFTLITRVGVQLSLTIKIQPQVYYVYSKYTWIIIIITWLCYVCILFSWRYLLVKCNSYNQFTILFFINTNVIPLIQTTVEFESIQYFLIPSESRTRLIFIHNLVLLK